MTILPNNYLEVVHVMRVERTYQAVSETTGVPVEQMLKRTRRYAVAMPRHLVRYILVAHYGMPLAEVARLTGASHHTTVMHSRNLVAAQTSGRRYAPVAKAYTQACERLQLAPIS
jgi:chromosomal replication initiation ATPase DnaA